MNFATLVSTAGGGVGRAILCRLAHLGCCVWPQVEGIIQFETETEEIKQWDHQVSLQHAVAEPATQPICAREVECAVCFSTIRGREAYSLQPHWRSVTCIFLPHMQPLNHHFPSFADRSGMLCC